MSSSVKAESYFQDGAEEETDVSKNFVGNLNASG